MQFDEDDGRAGSSGSFMIILVVVLFMLVGILGIVLLANQKKPSHVTTSQSGQLPANQVIEPDENEHVSSGLRAEDLDFWDMYPENPEQTIDTTEYAGGSGENIEPESVKEPEPEPEEEDPATDGKHTKVVLEDGSTTYLVINNSWPKNTYDDTQFQKENNRLKYYVNNRSTSTTGVDLSRCTGKIKFDRMKEDGISYVMLHLGGRGYDSGVVAIDERFKELADLCVEAGMQFGIVFSSQAVTGEEAMEEVQFIHENLATYNVKFPVVIEMTSAINDMARIERLTVEERSDILKTELSGLQEFGYSVLVAGDKRFLLTEIDLSKLTTYNVWYREAGELPDYPYQFAMWQYDKEYVDGIDEQVPISICFIDYAAR